MSATNVSNNISINTQSSFAPSGTPGSVTPAVNSQTFRCNLATGTAADQIDLKHSKQYSFAGSPIAIDLTAATDGYGTVNFARITSITIKVYTTTDGQTLKLGYAGTTANAWTSMLSNPGQITLEAATLTNVSMFVITAPNTTGWAVGSTNKLLEMDPGAATFLADVEICGRSV